MSWRSLSFLSILDSNLDIHIFFSVDPIWKLISQIDEVFDALQNDIIIIFIHGFFLGLWGLQGYGRCYSHTTWIFLWGTILFKNPVSAKFPYDQKLPWCSSYQSMQFSKEFSLYLGLFSWIHCKTMSFRVLLSTISIWNW